MRFARRPLALACVAITTTTLAACGGSHHHAASTSTSAAPATPSATQSTSTPAAVPQVNPFTGGSPATGPVVAVKIDDTANGRPQVNVNLADIVYVEQVEGGLTRLLAIFDSTLPTVVEAVRSTRASDPEIVAQYGPIAYAASGGAPNPLQVLDRSNLKTSINDRGGPGFSRDPNRPVPYNLVANLALIGKLLHGPRAKSIGLQWLANSDLSRTPAAPYIETVVGGTPVAFQWNAGLRRYVRFIDGSAQYTAAGRPIATPNVIVQFCQVSPYPQDIDAAGNPSVYTHTVGSGTAVVFRNGHRINGFWHRNTATSGTSFTTAGGSTITMAPGGAWIILVANGAPLTS